MREDYEITIIGRQTIDAQTDEIQVDTLGDYTERGGAKYISYTEYADEAPYNGQLKVLKIENEDTVTMLTPGTPTRLVYSPDIGSTIIEQAGESGVIENIIHAHLFFIIFNHFAQGKHVCSIWIYVFYIGSEHEWLVEILEGFNAYFAGIVWYHIFQYIQGACAFISLLNNLAFEHELSG